MSSTTKSIGTIEIFILFAHEDAVMQNELEKHLNILKRQGQITSWYSREINSSKEWAHEVDVHINTSYSKPILPLLKLARATLSIISCVITKLLLPMSGPSSSIQKML